MEDQTLEEKKAATTPGPAEEGEAIAIRPPVEPRTNSKDPPSLATLVSSGKGAGTELYDPHEHGLRRIARSFVPAWYIITMATGIVSILLRSLPYYGHWLGILSDVFFALNVVLFVSFTAISVLRYALYPELWGAMLQHPHQSLFTAAFPIGLGTIIVMTVITCVPAWGQGMATLAWVLWWIDWIIAVAICLLMTFTVLVIIIPPLVLPLGGSLTRSRVSFHKTDLSSMTALWLLPILSTVVASASGTIVAKALLNPQHQLWTLVISYVLWGIGFPLAMAVLVLYLLRLTIHDMPPREVIVTVFLPIGPLGLGGFCLVKFGQFALQLFPKTHTLPLSPNAGEILYVVGFMFALISWGFGLVWFFFAMATIWKTTTFPFNMGWWGFTFPIGVYAFSTITIGVELESRFFKVLGTVLTVIVVLLWIAVAFLTVQRTLRGQMLVAPCLTRYSKLQDFKDRNPTKDRGEKMV